MPKCLDLLKPVCKKKLIFFISFRIRPKSACSMKDEIYLEISQGQKTKVTLANLQPLLWMQEVPLELPGCQTGWSLSVMGSSKPGLNLDHRGLHGVPGYLIQFGCRQWNLIGLTFTIWSLHRYLSPTLRNLFPSNKSTKPGCCDLMKLWSWN